MSEHNPHWGGLVASGVFTRITGCTCGWQTPAGIADSEEAFTAHAALTATAAVTVSVTPNPDLDTASEDHADRVMSEHNPEPGARFTELRATFCAGARWHRDVEKSWTGEAGKIFQAAASALEAQRALHAELAQSAIAWARADRIADDRSAELERLQNEVDALPRQGRTLDAQRDALIAKYVHALDAFHRADQLAMRCDEDFRQAARKLEQEQGGYILPTVPA